MEEEINLKDYIQILNKRKWIILACLLLSILVGIAAYYLTTPVYSASAQIVLSQSAPPRYQSRSFINSLIKSDDFLNFAIRKLNLKYKTDELRKNIAVTSSPPQVVIAVSVNNPKKAARTANLLAERFVDEATASEVTDLVFKQKKLVQKELENLKQERKRILAAIEKAELEKAASTTEQLIKTLGLNSIREQLTDLHIAEINLAIRLNELEQTLIKGSTKIEVPASVPLKPTRPKLKFNLAVSALVGLIIGLTLATALESTKKPLA